MRSLDRVDSEVKKAGPRPTVPVGVADYFLAGTEDGFRNSMSIGKGLEAATKGDALIAMTMSHPIDDAGRP